MPAVTPEQIAQFEQDGFLNAGQILSDGEVDSICSELDRILEIGPDGFGENDPKPVLFRDLNNAADSEYKTEGAKPVWQIVNIWETSKAYEELVRHPTIVEAISQLTGFADLQVWHDQIQYKPAEAGGATKWHQDAPLWPSIEPDTPVSAWIPMDDADIENGCMWMVSGSHKWGNQMEHIREHMHEHSVLPQFKNIVPVNGSGEVEAQPCPVKRGEVHFHHSLTWHGSPENHSTRPRRAIAIHYMNSESHYTGHGHPMKKFINIPVGAAMRDAGPHFPFVCRNGDPLAYAD